MLLSIVILNYNTKDLTLACVKSIRKYPFSGNFEVIVVDNNSSDGSLEALRAYNKTHRKCDFDLIIIANKENSGFAKGNNVGILRAKGDHVLLLNSDTTVTKNALNNIVEFAINNDDAGVVAPKLLNTDGSLQSSVFRLPTVPRAFRQYILGETGLLDKYVPKCKKSCVVESVVGAAFLITHAAINKVGLLDERYFMYYEDLEYCRKTRSAGLSVYYLPETAVYHVHGASGASDAQIKRLVSASKIYHGNVAHYLIQFFIKVDRRLGNI